MIRKSKNHKCVVFVLMISMVFSGCKDRLNGAVDPSQAQNNGSITELGEKMDEYYGVWEVKSIIGGTVHQQPSVDLWWLMDHKVVVSKELFKGRADAVKNPLYELSPLAVIELTTRLDNQDDIGLLEKSKELYELRIFDNDRKNEEWKGEKFWENTVIYFADTITIIEINGALFKMEKSKDKYVAGINSEYDLKEGDVVSGLKVKKMEFSNDRGTIAHTIIYEGEVEVEGRYQVFEDTSKRLLFEINNADNHKLPFMPLGILTIELDTPFDIAQYGTNGLATIVLKDYINSYGVNSEEDSEFVQSVANLERIIQIKPDQFDYESLKGQWYESEEATSYEETKQLGGTILDIEEINDNYIKGSSMTIQKYTQRLADISFEGPLVNNQITFDYTDGFLNTGNATLTIIENRIEIVVNDILTSDENSTGFGYAGGTFVERD